MDKILHQLRLVVSPHSLQGVSTIHTVVVFRISEPSTVGMILMTDPWKNGMSVCLPIHECVFFWQLLGKDTICGSHEILLMEEILRQSVGS